MKIIYLYYIKLEINKITIYYRKFMIYDKCIKCIYFIFWLIFNFLAIFPEKNEEKEKDY